MYINIQRFEQRIYEAFRPKTLEKINGEIIAGTDHIDTKSLNTAIVKVDGLDIFLAIAKLYLVEVADHVGINAQIIKEG